MPNFGRQQVNGINAMTTATQPLEWSALWDAMKANQSDWIETTEEMNCDMLNCLPPRAGGNGRFLVGEPNNHNDQGEAVYACFVSRGDRYFAKYLTYREFRAL